MMFENTLADDPTTFGRFREHVPIAIGVIAVGRLMVGLHLAAIGVIAIAAAHIVAVGGVWLVRRSHGASAAVTASERS